jgi:hypothetical protein
MNEEQQEKPAEGMAAVIINRKVQFNRITVIEFVYHKAQDRSPAVHENRYTRMLASDEQFYSRSTKVGEGWKPLDLGWFEEDPNKIGLMVLVNDEGKKTAANKEEAEDVSKRILELGLKTDSVFALLPPGESMRFVPHKAEELVIRSSYGEARFTLKLYPV